MIGDVSLFIQLYIGLKAMAIGNGGPKACARMIPVLTSLENLILEKA